MGYKGNLRYIIKHLLHVVDPSFKGLSVALLVLVLSALFFSFVAHGFEALLNYVIKDKVIYALSLIGIGLLIYITLAILYIWQSKRYEGLDYEIREIYKLSGETVGFLPFKVIIFFVSIPNEDSLSENFQRMLKDPLSVNALIEDSKNRANWIIPLTLMYRLSKFCSIEKICPIYSPESYKFKDVFQEVINACLKDVKIEESVVDFFDLEKLQTMLTSLIKKLKSEFKEEEILLDVTAGAVPPSIIGASLTFRRNISIAYVTKDRVIHIYNIYEVMREH